MASTTKKLRQIIAWTLGILFLVLALGALNASLPATSLAYFAAAAIALPPSSRYLQSKISLLSRSSVRIVMIAVAFFAAPLLFGVNPDVEVAQPVSSQQESAEIPVNAVEATEPEDEAQEKQTDYQIVYELSGKRYDGGKNFYVLVENVDLSTADFKADIKRAVDEIVKSKGQKISIDFARDRGTLDIIYKSHYGNNTLGRTLTKAESDMIGVSLVAQFSGLLETDLYPNTLSFFPGTFTDNPTVGKYVETIEYNPAKM